KLAYMRHHGIQPGTPVGWEEVDAFAREHTRALADRLGLEYKGHIGTHEMEGPADFHYARVIYYLGVDGFNPRAVPGLPPGFIISRRFFGRDYAMHEAELAFAIASDCQHAFGEHVCPEEPVYLVAVTAA